MCFKDRYTIKNVFGYFLVALIAFSCSTSKQDNNGPDLSSAIEGVYKINTVALNGVDETNVSSPSNNVLVNRKGYKTCDISEVIGNAQTYFSEVPLTDVGSNKIEFAQTNGTASIRGYFLNGLLEYTLSKGSNYKVVKARR